MSNNSQGRKKSNFPAETSVIAGAFFDYVAAGVNSKISFADLLTALGATGTIVQDGAVAGTPILDVAGSVNNIRNLENGPGVKASVSPENGVTLEHNFLLDNSGVKLSDDFTLPAPIFRSLVAGPGISIGGVDDIIQISASAVAASTKTIVVTELADLPAAVANVITLAADTQYLFSNDVNLGINRLVMGDNTVITGASPNIIKITYTDTGDMITGIDVSCRIERITLECATGRAFNVSDSTGLEILQLVGMTISICDFIGLISGFIGCRIESCLFANQISGGFTFAGTLTTVVIASCAAIMQAGSFVDMGSSVVQSIDLDSNVLNLVGAGSVGITATGSSNIGIFGTLTKNKFRGAGTSISGFDKDDVRWGFSFNEGLPNTRPDSLSLNIAGTTVTIATLSVPVKIGGTWIDDNSSQFTVDGAGRVTYNGIVDFHTPVDAEITLDPVSGSNKDFQVCVAVNGVVVANSSVLGRASAGDLRSVTLIWQHIFSTGDYVELFVQNDTDTVNFNISKAVLRVN